MNDFADIVTAVFGFLTAEDGFRCEVQGPKRVVFSNGRVTIQLGLGDHGGVGMTFDRVPPASNSYPFALYLETFVPSEYPSFDGCVAKSRLELEIGLTQLARLLVRYGKPLFSGDRNMFEQMDAKFQSKL